MYILIADVRFFVTRSVYLSSPESCCTPAVIFRAAKIPEIVSRLSTEAVAPGHAKDHILDDSAFVGRQTDTNLVVHIGAKFGVAPIPDKMREPLYDGTATFCVKKKTTTLKIGLNSGN
ncbi:unnamed protein product [Heligmosomoides polygyrus]|uniref:Transposase n=1 Tax=Heligmosomoides polygyrus TaxID=6339 RepID=A0A183G7C5_HELPZ|nr:unnamed protein product [Heligmosomoides polygyrus]